MPPQLWKRKSRRERKYRTPLPRVEKFVQVEDDAGEIRECAGGKEVLGEFQLTRTGLAGKSDRVSQMDLLRLIGRRRFFQTLRKNLRLAQDEIVIHQRERLRGHGSNVARTAGDVLVGKIESVKKGERQRALAIDVNAAPPDFRTVLLLLLPDAGGNRLQDFRSKHRKHGRAADFRIEVAADGEDGIANDFRVEAFHAMSPVQVIVRI